MKAIMPFTQGRGRRLRGVIATSIALLALTAVGEAQASSVACFAPADAKEAQLRRMQQEFTVAALSCGAVQAQRDALTDRYNQFVGKFGVKLKDNARILEAHFLMHGGGRNGFDTWMTKLANAASESLALDPNYCRNAWLNLDAALTITPDNIVEFAANGRTTDELVPICGEQKPRVAKHTKTAAHRRKTADTQQN
jgi:hypothetical protein